MVYAVRDYGGRCQIVKQTRTPCASKGKEIHNVESKTQLAIIESFQMGAAHRRILLVGSHAVRGRAGPARLILSRGLEGDPCCHTRHAATRRQSGFDSLASRAWTNNH